MSVLGKNFASLSLSLFTVMKMSIVLCLFACIIKLFVNFNQN